MAGSDKKIVWQPNSKPQAFFLCCPFPEMLFGGARGPGKTDSLLMSYIQFVGRGYGADWKGIIFRQTYKQLEEIVAKSKRFFPKIIRGASFGAGKYEWTFPGGETLKFRHAKRPADMENYQGHEYPFVGFDELCNLPSQEVYEKAKGFCRSSNPRVPKMIRCTANPLGPGHLWVKRYFVEPEEPLTPIVDASGSKRVFIPATIYDNTHLVTADPDYLRRLESIADDSLRRAWLEGDWDVVAGSFFGDVWSPARNVLKPFKIPAEWYCYRSFDWGSAKPFSVGWWAISDGNKAPDGNTYPRGAIIRIAEWYGAKRDNAGQTVPNEGLKMGSRDVARGIKEREARMNKEWGISIKPGPADPAIYSSDDGPSVADNMSDEGVRWVRADNSRVTGWQQMRERMWGDGESPQLYVFANCTEFIRTVPAAPRDELIPDDIDTDFEDHVADEARYSCMFRKREVRFGF